MRNLGISAIAGACLIAAGPGLAAGGAPQPTSVVPPARDGAVALEEQYQAALAAQGNAALINFIARDPDAPQAAEARAVLRSRPGRNPGTGPDAEIHLAFDRARAVGTPAAMAAFIAHYPNHPLTAEAARPVWTAPR